MFVELSAWPTAVNLVAAAIVIVFFVGAIASYVYHGWRRDTVNQFSHPVSLLRPAMLALIVGEIGGTAVLIAGFVDGQF